jgi:hypothetical protein
VPSTVDHLLAAPLHFGVVALDAGEVEILLARAAGHRAGGATAEADQHGGPAQHDQAVTRLDRALAHVAGADVAQTAGEHDGLVVAAQLGALRLQAAGTSAS